MYILANFKFHLDNSNEKKRISNSLKSVFSAAYISDYLAVISEINGCKTKLNKEKISLRKINRIESFQSDFLNSDLIKKPEKDLPTLCQQYDSALSSIVTNTFMIVSTKESVNQKITYFMDDSGNNKG